MALAALNLLTIINASSHYIITVITFAAVPAATTITTSTNVITRRTE